jgi:hypothetical protein
MHMEGGCAVFASQELDQHPIARRKGLQKFSDSSLRSPVFIGGMFWLH